MLKKHPSPELLEHLSQKQLRNELKTSWLQQLPTGLKLFERWVLNVAQGDAHKLHRHRQNKLELFQ